MENVKEIPIIKLKHRFFENSFFSADATEWNDLDFSLRNASSVNIFKQNVLKLILLGPDQICNIYIPHDLKVLPRLHLDSCSGASFLKKLQAEQFCKVHRKTPV